MSKIYVLVTSKGLRVCDFCGREIPREEKYWSRSDGKRKHVACQKYSAEPPAGKYA